MSKEEGILDDFGSGWQAGRQTDMSYNEDVSDLLKVKTLFCLISFYFYLLFCYL